MYRRGIGVLCVIASQVIKAKVHFLRSIVANTMTHFRVRSTLLQAISSHIKAMFLVHTRVRRMCPPRCIPSYLC